MGMDIHRSWKRKVGVMAKRARKKIARMEAGEVSEEMAKLLDKGHGSSKRYQQLRSRMREFNANNSD